jgi:hypothetical protein
LAVPAQLVPADDERLAVFKEGWSEGPGESGSLLNYPPTYLPAAKCPGDPEQLRASEAGKAKRASVSVDAASAAMEPMCFRTGGGGNCGCHTKAKQEPAAAAIAACTHLCYAAQRPVCFPDAIYHKVKAPLQKSAIVPVEYGPIISEQVLGSHFAMVAQYSLRWIGHDSPYGHV